MNKEDGNPTPLSVIRNKRDRADTDALLACLREDTKSILGLDDLAGYALVAWGPGWQAVSLSALIQAGEFHTRLHSAGISADGRSLVDRRRDASRV